MVLLSISHPSAEVRRLAFAVQADLEMVLRVTDDAIQTEGELPGYEYRECLRELERLGELLSSFGRIQRHRSSEADVSHIK